MNINASIPIPSDDDESGTTSSGRHVRGAREVRWEVVAHTSGILPARIIAGRLESDGIPTRVWQESVGQAYGFTFGPLGTGYVAVPQEFAAEARAYLDEVDASPDLDDDE